MRLRTDQERTRTSLYQEPEHPAFGINGTASNALPACLPTPPPQQPVMTSCTIPIIYMETNGGYGIANSWTNRHQNLHGWLRRGPLPLCKILSPYDYPLCPPNMRKCVLSDSASFFWFFRQPTAKTPAPIFTINTSCDAVSRKDVPFGGPKNKILHLDPIFPRITQIFRQFSTGRVKRP